MALFLVLLVVSAASDSYAGIYKYIDRDGVICFADDLQQVPEQYRASAVIVEGELKEDNISKKTDSVEAEREQQRETAEEKAGPQSRAPRPLSIRLMISGAVSIAVVLLIVVIGKQPEVKNNERLDAVVRNSLIATLSLYLVFAHAKDVLTAFGMVDRAVEEVQQRSAEKGRKAARAIKALDALFEEAEKAEKSQGHYLSGTDEK